MKRKIMIILLMTILSVIFISGFIINSERATRQTYQKQLSKMVNTDVDYVGISSSNDELIRKDYIYENAAYSFYVDSSNGQVDRIYMNSSDSHNKHSIIAEKKTNLEFPNRQKRFLSANKQ